MKNYVQRGEVLDLTPNIAVASGVGFLFGAALFGVAKGDVAANTEGPFQTEGVIDIAKTSALAIAVGDRVFWDAANKCVNKTSAAQQQVGIAVAAAVNPSSTVRIKLISALPVAT
jgi:predicted RecA/RadA family phage recombinase